MSLLNWAGHGDDFLGFGAIAAGFRLKIAGWVFQNLQITASIINLTKSEQRQHLGNDTKDRFISNEYAGRRAYLGFAYKF